MDLRCCVCHGDSVGNPDRPCRTCSSEGWIEWGGCGMVNPRVLVACGIDPDALHRLRVRHGHRAHADVPARRRGHARHGRGRRAVRPPVRDGDLMRAPLSWLREYVDLPADVTGRDARRRGWSRAGLEVETVERPGRRHRRARGRRPGARRSRTRPQSNGKTDPLVPGRRRRGRAARHRLRRAQLRRRRPRRGRAARRDAARRLRDRRPQDLRARLATA